MPRKRSGSATAVSSAFRQVQQQARSLMVNLHKEIRAKEIELRRLKEEEARLVSLIGQSSKSSNRGRASKKPGPSRSGRVIGAKCSNNFPRNSRLLMFARFAASRASVHRRSSLRSRDEIDLGAARRRSRGMYEKI